MLTEKKRRMSMIEGGLDNRDVQPRVLHEIRIAQDRYQRRGVSSILAMMFLVIFASLASVMAVVAQGNLRTANSHLQVSRAMGAAETGLVFAQRRLSESTARFIVDKGTVDSEFGDKLWNGTWDGGDGTVQILEPDGFSEAEDATSIATAVMNAHLADSHNVILEPEDELLPDVDEFGKVVVQPISINAEDPNLTFQLSYTPLADGRFIRITCVGRDRDVMRTLQTDLLIAKRLDAAIISPNRIMIGKNVHINGPIGSRYGENEDDLEEENGHPLVVRSDFLYLDETLDDQIIALITAISEYDIDGDNRLRPQHPTESIGLTEDYMIDYSNDGYVDDYDLFVAFYDSDSDDNLIYDELLADSAGYPGPLTVDFEGIDDQLAILIDTADPDRNNDEVIDDDDTALGYLDGVINNLDGYSKINGNLLFKTTKSAWETAQGGISYHEVVQGPIRSDLDTSSTEFDVPDSRLYDLRPEDFESAQDVLKAAALAGLSFDQQVVSQLGGSMESHTWTDHATDPDYLRYELNEWEQMPLGSPGFYDWYKRPVFKNMTFVNTKIPMGTNALFDNCIFVGAVYVESHCDNNNVNWNFLGMKEKIGFSWIDKFDYEQWEPAVEIPSGNPIYDTKPFSNNIRYHDCLVIGSVVSDPITQFTHVRNKLQFTGATRFTLDISEISQSNLPEGEKTQAVNAFNNVVDELAKSSLMSPNFSVDIGSFENSGEVVELQGTIVAGVLDIRGNANIVGTLLMTFDPEAGQGPLNYGGSVASFNTTIGYFGPEDGDGEGSPPDPAVGFGAISITYDPELPMPDGIRVPLKIEFVSGTYSEGGAL